MNDFTAKIHINELDEWYDVDSLGLDDIKEQIRETIDEDSKDEADLEDIEVSFDDFDLPSLFKSFDITPDNLEDIVEAVESLQKADYEMEVYEAYADNNGYPSTASDMDDLISNADEAYQGEYSSDEAFARTMADDIGAVDKNASWPMNCIDWEQAASELMYDYFESNGYYFRNI